MPFEHISQRVPTSIPSIILILRCLESKDEQGNPVSTRSADYQLYVNDQDGQHLCRRQGDLRLHLSDIPLPRPQDVTGWDYILQFLMDGVRTLAEEAILQP